MKGHIDTTVFFFLNIDVIQCVVMFVGVKGLTVFFFFLSVCVCVCNFLFSA